LILGSDSHGQLALRSSLVTSLMNLDTFTGIRMVEKINETRMT
jgi:hypothetical protein